MTKKKKLPDLLVAPGDRVRHMAIKGGAEKGGFDIAYEKSDDPRDGWHLTWDENGKPVKRRVKWTFQV